MAGLSFGYGIGLPLSRLHAKYLGGTLDLVSLPGFGVDDARHNGEENGEMMRFRRSTLEPGCLWICL